MLLFKQWDNKVCYFWEQQTGNFFNDTLYYLISSSLHCRVESESSKSEWDTDILLSIPVVTSMYKLSYILKQKYYLMFLTNVNERIIKVVNHIISKYVSWEKPNATDSIDVWETSLWKQSDLIIISLYLKFYLPLRSMFVNSLPL